MFDYVIARLVVMVNSMLFAATSSIQNGVVLGSGYEISDWVQRAFELESFICNCLHARLGAHDILPRPDEAHMRLGTVQYYATRGSTKYI